MELSKLQNLASLLYAERHYIADLPTLGLGLCEEAGEVAKAINLLNPLYRATPDREHHDLAHELCDLLVYAAHIANKANINLDVVLFEKFYH